MRANYVIAFTLCAAACGSSSKPMMPDAAKNGFMPPAAPLDSWDNTGSTPVDLMTVDLSCLNTPSTDAATTVAVTLTTVVKDFQSHDPVPMAVVAAFDGVDSTAPFVTGTADENGNLSLVIPAGRKRFGFEMTTPNADANDQTLPTLLLNQYLNPDPGMTTQTFSKIQSVSEATALTLPALIGETRQNGTGVLAGALRDCSDHEISNFTATVSSTQGTATPIDGAETYYFQPGTDLPVRAAQEPSSSSDGLFMVIQLPVAATAYVQMWGFKNATDLASNTMTLIAELQVPVLADTVITGDYLPLRQ
ncbi:MAG TPA: hypothetical protein VMJ10_05635 [Kofleriaceae bacterium]|nr:hypothetical protein [Kofleriaceae bacterium]